MLYFQIAPFVAYQHQASTPGSHIRGGCTWLSRCRVVSIRPRHRTAHPGRFFGRFLPAPARCPSSGLASHQNGLCCARLWWRCFHDLPVKAIRSVKIYRAATHARGWNCPKKSDLKSDITVDSRARVELPVETTESVFSGKPVAKHTQGRADMVYLPPMGEYR